MTTPTRSVEKYEAAMLLLGKLREQFLESWHWFGYHVVNMTPFMLSIARACVELERIDPGAPERMLRELASIRGSTKHKPDYNKLLQKLSEILVMQQISIMPWPVGTEFKIEGVGPGGSKRIDLVTILPDGKKIGFEVKAPDYLKHAESRGDGDVLVPSRLPDGSLEHFRKIAENIVLPRDNTIRDFLRSANEKFAAFGESSDFAGLLVIVWDDHIYEAIGPLVEERQGLLTERSYSKNDAGEPERYPHVDGVILLRHLQYFASDSAGHPLPDGRNHAMHIGGNGALPNVFLPIPGGQPIADFIVAAFGAVPLDHPSLENVADYRPKDFVLQVKY